MSIIENKRIARQLAVITRCRNLYRQILLFISSLDYVQYFTGILEQLIQQA